MIKRLGFVARCLAVLLMVMGIVGTWAVANSPYVMADEKDDDKKSKANNNVGDGEGGADDNDSDHDTTGQVMSIHAERAPQEIILANGDGLVTVKLLKANLLTESGAKPGDHIRVTGEKVHEQLFEATYIDIRSRCCGEPTSDNDDDSDNVSDPGTIERGQKYDDDGEAEDEDDDGDEDD